MTGRRPSWERAAIIFTTDWTGSHVGTTLGGLEAGVANKRRRRSLARLSSAAHRLLSPWGCVPSLSLAGRPRNLPVRGQIERGGKSGGGGRGSTVVGC